MEKINREIIDKIDEVIYSIKDTKEYKTYFNILKQVEDSNLINEKISKIKSLQKELVKTPSIKLNEELEKEKKELYDIPLYNDFIDSVDELNGILLDVKYKMDLFVKDITLD